MSNKDNVFQALMAKLSGTSDVQLDELKAVAFEVLLATPGCEQSDWTQILVDQYGSEVVDTFGDNPEDAYASLEDLWDSPYRDPNSGLEYTFNTWAECFCNESSVQMYHDMIEKKLTIKQDI